MKKNVAGQHVGAQMISATDGSNFSGTVTVYVTGDAGTQAIGSVSSGVCTSKGNGYYTYAPAQAETNYDVVAFTFTGSGAISATRELYTEFPQTGDNYARLGAPSGASVSADIAAIQSTDTAIKAKTDNLPASPASTTNITAGTITTVSGNVNGSVGSVTGAVGSVTSVVSANISQINGITVHGSGTSGSKWGP